MAKKRKAPKRRRPAVRGTRLGRSRQKKHGGGKFKSERQRRGMWARAPRAARKWAHNKKTTKSDWAGMRSKRRRRRKRRKSRK